MPRASEIKEIFRAIARNYDLNNTILSAGMHHGWRRKLLAWAEPHPGLRALDLCTGTGDIACLLARGGATTIGVDFSPAMLDQARRKLERKKLADRVSLLQADGLQLPFPDQTFDLVTIAFGVRNFEKPEAGIKEAARVLKKEGSLLVLELGKPSGRWTRSLYWFYSHYLMPWLAAPLTRDRHAYRYLHESLWRFPCGAEFEAMLQHCGLKTVRWKSLTLGTAYLYHARIRG
ncbi:MAG: bifunctional demethylmenaquinone methyltransferase/2-methoxy-6-polyprenyl-1,4-benzoquinol methylase UbiE [Deltaproteobacteria bacterium]|nr:bifunctional demethylmenaquinone methyltransferase/2-methoxy-6-polyprenyl-1,4-benzoquinol methylase UbiE [Deltaproteobacteria bacterium]